LKIAHGFSRGFSSAQILKSRQGRKKFPAVPRGTFHFAAFLPSLERLGFFQSAQSCRGESRWDSRTNAPLFPQIATIGLKE
jgi:hypothetical protein